VATGKFKEHPEQKKADDMILNAPWLHGPAKIVCNLLEENDYQSFFVGGCVRNEIMGVPVADLDLSTNARPEMVLRLFEDAGFKVIPSGIEHGTVTVMCGGEPIEITTFRRDVQTDGRRAVVAFSDNIEDDARRRDFTMNALYCDIRGEVTDPLGGLEDLEARRVVFIEDAGMRIKEDYLRILRFFRFNALYCSDTVIDPVGLAACAENAAGIDSLSAERITSEMFKILAAPNPMPALSHMKKSGVLDVVLPGAELVVLKNLRTIEKDLQVEARPIRHLAALGGDTSRFRLSKKQQTSIDQCKETSELRDMRPHEVAYRHGANVASDIKLLQSAEEGVFLPVGVLEDLERSSEEIFPLTARDLMPDLKGPELGAALKSLEATWIASGFAIARHDLLAELTKPHVEEDLEPG
jgi:poly(A) polymerase